MTESVFYYALLRTQFFSFYEKVFLELEGKHLVDNWHLHAIAHKLEMCNQGEILRLLVNMPPRGSKSLLITVAYSLFVLGNNPRAKIIVVSHTQDLVEHFNNQCRRIMETNWFQEAFPECRISSMKNSASEITTTLGGFRLAISVGGGLTGRGADLIIMDDVNKSQDGQSRARRKSVIDWYDGTLQTRLNNLNKGVIICIQQRLHVDDISGHLLRKGNVWKRHHLVLPAIASETQVVPIGIDKNYTFKEGECLFPAFLGAEVLKDQKESMGTQNYLAQYQQHPIDETGSVIPINKFRRYREPPKPRDGDVIINSWDTATKTGINNDYTVGTVWLCRFNEYYLLNMSRGKFPYPVMFDEVVNLALGSKARWVLIEDTNLGSWLADDLESRTSLNIERINPRGDKIFRMEACSALIETGKVSIPEEAIWREDFLHECSGFPDGSRHKDIVDSMSQALNWAKSISHGYLYTQKMKDGLDGLAEAKEPDDLNTISGIRSFFLKNFKPEGE